MKYGMIVVERSLKNVDWHSVLEMLSSTISGRIPTWYLPYFFDRAPHREAGSQLNYFQRMELRYFGSPKKSRNC